ncbi:MAG TPA: hypothetical protein VNJ28_06775, partial [Candidatus Limnocylindrales bacterium]|nr:hypothetical protein [Candidatus Limnocylindrales bacterium]
MIDERALAPGGFVVPLAPLRCARIGGTAGRRASTSRGLSRGRLSPFPRDPLLARDPIAAEGSVAESSPVVLPGPRSPLDRAFVLYRRSAGRSLLVAALLVPPVVLVGAVLVTLDPLAGAIAAATLASVALVLAQALLALRGPVRRSSRRLAEDPGEHLPALAGIWAFLATAVVLSGGLPAFVAATLRLPGEAV